MAAEALFYELLCTSLAAYPCKLYALQQRPARLMHARGVLPRDSILDLVI